MCRRANASIIGQNVVITAIQHSAHQPLAAVYLASDASERTRKQITNKCNFYNLSLFELPCTSEAVGHALGKEAPVAVLATTSKPFAESIQRLLEQN